MVRTQLYLDDSLHRRLKVVARKQGRTVSDLVREAIARAYGREDEGRTRTLDGIASLWQNREDLGDTLAYARRVRGDTRRRRRPG